MKDAQAQINAILRIRQHLLRRRHAGGANRRPARQYRRRRQPDGSRHDLRPFGELERRCWMRSRRNSRPRSGPSKPTSTAAGERRNQSAEGRRAEKLLAFGEGKTGAFKLRQKELDAIDYGQPCSRRPASSMSVSTSACSNSSMACRGGTNGSAFQVRQRDFVCDHGDAGARRPRLWSDRRCSSGAMSAATSCAGSAACSARCSCCPTGDLEARSTTHTSTTRSRRWRRRCRFSAKA